MTLLLFALLVTQGPMQAQTAKKGTHYYRPYNRYRRPEPPPLTATPEAFGWAHVISRTPLLEAFWRRNKLRAALLDQTENLKFKNVIKTFKLDPESGDGRFLLQFYLHLAGKKYTLPKETETQPDSRSALIEFFTSLKEGDLNGMARRLNSLGASSVQRLRLMVFLANRLKREGFTNKAYTLYRSALRILEGHSYNLRLSWIRKQRWHRFLVITLAEIAFLRGEYRKAFGILKWVPKAAPSKAPLKVDCTIRQILTRQCKKSHKHKRLQTDRLIGFTPVEISFHQALLTWRSSWQKGTKAFGTFLRRHPKAPQAPVVKKCLVWLKYNPK